MRQKSPSHSRPAPGRAPRGAPRGNKNALKHGFYSRELAPTDLDGFKNLDPLSLDNEIILLRAILRRLVAASRGITDFDRLSSLMRTCAFASLSLTRLMRTRFLIQGKSSLLSDEVDEAIQELFGHRASLQDPRTLIPNSDPSLPEIDATFHDPIAPFPDPDSPDHPRP